MPCVPNSLLDWQKRKRNKSSLDLDRFHQQLLLSSNDKDLLHGFWSVVFWGYFSGTDGIFRPGRAISRVKWLIDGKSVHTPQHQPPTPNSILINYLRDARCLALEGRFGLALEALMKIRFVGMSFGSKIVMFMHPERAAVYDQVIARKILADTSFDRMLVVDPSLAGHVTSKCAAYDAWCHYCDNKASSLNSSNSQWVDWTGIQHPWRAVDVERAIFAAPG